MASLSNSMHCCGWGGGVNLSFSSTWTRACASMLPAGVLLTQRYHVPSYTSTLLMRKVPFLKTSNRESSEMSIWFLYQTTVGFGVAWVRQCK